MTKRRGLKELNNLWLVNDSYIMKGAQVRKRLKHRTVCFPFLADFCA